MAIAAVPRDRLLDIAQDLMSRRGYAGTSVSDIVGAAGVGPPTLYWHFKSKEGILAAVMARGAERWLEALPGPDEISGADVRARVFEALDRASAAIQDDPQFLRLLMLLALERGEHDHIAMATIRSIRRRSRAWIVHIMRAAWPQLTAADAQDLAFSLMAFADGWCLRQLVEPAHASVDEVRWFNNIILDRAEARAAECHGKRSHS